MLISTPVANLLAERHFHPQTIHSFQSRLTAKQIRTRLKFAYIVFEYHRPSRVWRLLKPRLLKPRNKKHQLYL